MAAIIISSITTIHASALDLLTRAVGGDWLSAAVAGPLPSFWGGSPSAPRGITPSCCCPVV